jgi:biotin carboxyl carrier protein
MEDGSSSPVIARAMSRTGGTPVFHRNFEMIYNVAIDGTVFRLDLDLDRETGSWRCMLHGREVQIDAVLAQPDVLSIIIAGRAYQIRRERLASDLRIWVGDQPYTAEVSDPRSLRNRKARADSGKGPRPLVAPMPGKVVRFLVGVNSPVEAGQGVVVVEAMKMQNEIKSPKKGKVLKLAVAEGAAVNAGDVLAIVE